MPEEPEFINELRSDKFPASTDASLLNYIDTLRALATAPQAAESKAEGQLVGYQGWHPKTGEVVFSQDTPAQSVMADYKMRPVYSAPPPQQPGNLHRAADTEECAVYAAIATDYNQQPDDCVRVPVKLTAEMAVAFSEVWFSKERCIDDPEMDDAYAALLAAAKEQK